MNGGTPGRTTRALSGVDSPLAAFLRGTDQLYDLVVAADVFIYIGDLEPKLAKMSMTQQLVSIC